MVQDNDRRIAMNKTLKTLASTALLLAFAFPMQGAAAHWHGHGYAHGPHYGPGYYHPWHGRGFGRGYGGLSGGFGFSVRGGSYGRGWGRGYGNPYRGYHPHRRHWQTPSAMHSAVTAQSPSTGGSGY
jgi:hypothetical protein